MRSKRDQVQAHTFMMGRLTSGMLLADPDAPESPLGRTTRGALIGLIVGVLVSAGALVYGFIKPGGNDSWRSGDTLIVNKDTGARYLYADGRLRPVRNYASAMLIGGADLSTTAVGTASLSGTPVGTPIGITGAPDTVPGTGSLETSAWLVCSTGSGTPTTLVPGAPVQTRAVGADKAVLVRGPDERTYLVWQGSRLRLDEKSGAAVSLGYGSVTPRPVSAAFLDALVAGPALSTPEVSGRGDKGPELGGSATRLGQVFRVRVTGSGSQEYVLRKDGLYPVTATQAALLLGDPATRKDAYAGAAPSVTDLGASDLRAHQAPGTAGEEASAGGLPVTPPRITSVDAAESACAQVSSESGGTRVASVLVDSALLVPAAQADTSAMTGACVAVDRVVARPGHGTLVRALGAAGATVGDTTYLVDDDGVKYRIADATSLKALGYDGQPVRTVPSPLLSMLPTGPELSAKAASNAAAAPGGGTPVDAAQQCGSATGRGASGTAVKGPAGGTGPASGGTPAAPKGAGDGSGSATSGSGGAPAGSGSASGDSAGSGVVSSS
ncbi:type VII secretion protein EccB [Streptomyces sp. NPDC090306]|uniref:type VII secretion protein EccB n=1 Tax=Streptomyces sp. NPDC090306 TaxID=3365961 RepID=UPI0038186718